MITEWFFGLVSGFVTWIASAVPDWSPPDWLVSLDDRVNGVTSAISGLGAWVPWALLFVCVTAALGTWVVCLGIKVVRAVLAHVPAFGGAG